jgi:hypothetical protein
LYLLQGFYKFHEVAQLFPVLKERNAKDLYKARLINKIPVLDLATFFPLLFYYYGDVRSEDEGIKYLAFLRENADRYASYKEAKAAWLAK